MRVRVTTTVLGLTAVTVLALPACSTHSSESKPATSSATRAGIPVNGERQTAPLSSAALERLLLDESDLGSGYTRTPERPAQHDDVTVLGCPALDELGGDAVTGGSLDFPRKAKASFTYTGDSNSAVSEELYSDTADNLSDGTGRIFAAMTGCPAYQVLSGSTAIDVTTQRMSAPQLGDKQWSMLLTFSAGGRDSVVKQTAIRSGNVLLTVSGAPALVDQHLDKALAKVTASR
ncbi:hypothetical protein PV416_02210 [Streptomyces ipomoeae]|uniref:hypothetical protein n=1 Tax=Streptomyces ipomoeae TaxID=103232 RepID=UPI0029A3D7D5|nr:hypothetical protein [Streptomyces ipomoeae]MDX2819916.1 hypothetical protein [Streptomyces ipomoeae]MDX2872639.1 hypothetical protein [Streptomyces ipomoeae]